MDGQEWTGTDILFKGVKWIGDKPFLTFNARIFLCKKILGFLEIKDV